MANPLGCLKNEGNNLPVEVPAAQSPYRGDKEKKVLADLALDTLISLRESPNLGEFGTF
jgi:hypothetical protein